MSPFYIGGTEAQRGNSFASDQAARKTPSQASSSEGLAPDLCFFSLYIVGHVHFFP